MYSAGRGTDGRDGGKRSVSDPARQPLPPPSFVPPVRKATRTYTAAQHERRAQWGRQWGQVTRYNAQKLRRSNL